MELDVTILVLWMLNFKPAVWLSSFTFIKRFFSSSLLSAVRVVSSAYLRLLIFLLTNLIPVCASFSLAFLIMYSAYKLNKQGDSIQPWCTPFPLWNQLLFYVWFYCFLTCMQVSQETGKVIWYSHLLKNFLQFVVIHAGRGFNIVNEAEIDVIMAFSCFFYDPVNVGNLISGSSTFYKLSLYIWKFSVHVLLKPRLEDFEHDIASMWNECSCAVVWTLFGIAFFGVGMKTDLFQSCGHCWVFQICWHIECSTFTASSFRIRNNWTGIPSPPLALFVVMLPKAHLTSHSRMSALGEWSYHCGYPGD